MVFSTRGWRSMGWSIESFIKNFSRTISTNKSTFRVESIKILKFSVELSENRSKLTKHLQVVVDFIVPVIFKEVKCRQLSKYRRNLFSHWKWKKKCTSRFARATKMNSTAQDMYTRECILVATTSCNSIASKNMPCIRVFARAHAMCCETVTLFTLKNIWKKKKRIA